jgi:hypothetical protein
MRNLRFALGIDRVSDTAEPIYFLPRLVMFSLIVMAIIGEKCDTQRPLKCATRSQIEIGNLHGVP